MRAATIVGAGLVGSLWAIFLRKRGYEVNLFEKRKDPRSFQWGQGRSINLVITSRGLYALQRAGLADEALAISIPIFGRMVHGKAGEAQFQRYGRENECNYSISRQKLNGFLIDTAERAGVNFHFEHQLDHCDFLSKEVQFIHDQKKITGHYEILFGTDGAGSEVRKKLNHSKIEWLEADYKELLMPAAPSGPILDKNSLHIWPRGSHMLMALANTDGSFTLTLYLPRQGPISFEKVKTPEQIKNLFETEFPDSVSLLPHYIDEYQQNPQGTLGTVRSERWILGSSVALMGDAAHAIIPFFGQGMNCGFEDCTTLIDLLDKHNDDWEKILPSYEKIRKPEANAIAEMSIDNWAEMKDRVGDIRFLLRKKVESFLEEHFPEIYKSRYGMVTYTLIPYSLAQKAGLIQNRILDELCQGISSPDEIQKERALYLLKSELLPFLKENKISLENY